MKNYRLQFKTLYFALSFCILIFVFYIFVAAPVFAAEIFFNVQTQEIAVGDQFEVAFFLNTENNDINAVEGLIVFPSDLLVFMETRNGNSIINFWVEQPTLKTLETIIFSGIVPGGYNGNQGALFSLVFQANKEGFGVVGFRDVRVLKNDGLGTSASVRVKNFPLSVAAKRGEPKELPAHQDGEPPERFMPEIAQNPNMFGGKHFLVFTTQDKGVGISHYEVREGNAEFAVAMSPHLLINQKLDKKIFIKAVDKNGNERVVVLYPPNFRPWYKNWLLLGILIMAGLILAGLIRRKNS